MTETLVFTMRAMGAVVDVFAGPGVSPRLIETLVSAWTDCEACPAPEPSSVPDPEHVSIVLAARKNPVPATAVGGREVPVLTVDADVPRVAQEFTSLVTLELIRRHIGRMHLFHAAALMRPETGQVIALVGPSGRGKTTASRALARAGWVYLSDETCAIDPETLVVLPYPKPLSIIEKPGEPKTQTAASALGLRHHDPASSLSPELARVVVLDRVDAESRPHEDAAAAGLRRLPLLEALQVLAEQSSGLARTRDGLLRLAELADRFGGIDAVTYTDSSQLPELLADLLETRRDAGAEPWKYIAGSAPVEPARHDLPRSDRPDMVVREPSGSERLYSRSVGTCGIVTDHGMLLMHPERTVIYSQLGADLWIEAGAGRTRHHLEERLSEIYGPPPPGAFDAVLDTILEDGGLVASNPSSTATRLSDPKEQP
jgi:hypothetical protein